jgi:hypothetical protein
MLLQFFTVNFYHLTDENQTRIFAFLYQSKSLVRVVENQLEFRFFDELTRMCVNEIKLLGQAKPNKSKLSEIVKLFYQNLKISQSLKSLFGSVIASINTFISSENMESVRLVLCSFKNMKDSILLPNLMNLLMLMIELKAIYRPQDKKINCFESNSESVESHMKILIGPLTNILKDEVGVVRKNSGLLLARIMMDPACKEYSQQFNTMKILMNLKDYLV